MAVGYKIHNLIFIEYLKYWLMRNELKSYLLL